MKILLLALICALYVKLQAQTVKPIVLNSGWQFRQLGNEVWDKAIVPGCVQLDLIKAGLLPEPYLSDNEKKIQWVENEDWEYSCEFTIDKDYLKNENIELVLEGIDTYASVMLNNTPIQRTDNFYRKWEINIKKHIKEGKNTLLLQLFSPIKIAKNLSKKLPYTLPGDEKVFVRKPAFQFGWDFAPRIVTTGIWKPVYIKAWNKTRIKEMVLSPDSLTEKKGKIKVNLAIESAVASKADVYCTLITNGIAGKPQKKQVQLKKGTNNFEDKFSLDSVQLWWPRGYGNQNQYKVTAKIVINKIKADSLSQKIGIRNIELVQEPDSIGKSFYFKINGLPVFMRGANYVPADVFPSRLGMDYYKNIFETALNCNMNMLRIWGGGLYETEAFYNFCDSTGLLVWQDFMFACSMYPGDSLFLANVKQEAIEQVRRLRAHPCIALWCGNNEIDEGWHNWGWQKQYNYSQTDSAKIWENYKTLFHKLLPEVLAKNDPSKIYWPSSPKIGWGKAGSMLEGDAHYWGVWWGKEPFAMYQKKVGRFMSEYGFQAYPQLQSLNKFNTDINADIINIASHQKHPEGNEIIKKNMLLDFKNPKNFESYVYLSGLTQAYGMKTAIEAHRMAKPYCMGTLYWQLNDCWPGISWSGTDYFGKWKAAQYFIKKAYSNVLIMAQEKNGTMQVHIVSDKPKKSVGTLQMKLIDYTGKESWSKSYIIEVPGNSSKIHYSIKTDELFPERKRGKYIFQALIKERDSVVTSSEYYFISPKELKLTNPEIIYTIEQKGDEYLIKFTAATLAKNVYLSATGDVWFSNNYFDILPKGEEIIRCRTSMNIDDLKTNLKIESLFDSYLEN